VTSMVPDIASKPSNLLFLSPLGTQVHPPEWLRVWAALYPAQKYAAEHDRLLAKGGSLSAADFERIGRWKDAANSEAKWRPNVASVAYDVWMQAAAMCPRCPEDNRVPEFLSEWSEKVYSDRSSQSGKKRFGLSRATTLLYFLSRARFPIFDSRVRNAVRRLRGRPVRNDIDGYLEVYAPLSKEIALRCGTTDMRIVDQALFSYGGRTVRFEADPR
jgi:hypothetical protein